MRVSSELRPDRWLTRANALSLLRVLAAPLLVLALGAEREMAALGLFLLAVASDLADGAIARRYGEASHRGGLVDHASDALFVTAGLGALAHAEVVPTLLPWLVAAAFLQYTLDSRALAGERLRASRLGRWNGIGYFVLLGIPLVRDGLGLGWPAAGAVRLLGWLLVASTLLSMLDRLAARRS